MCNSNHSWSTIAGICPSLNHCDDLDDVGAGGGHIDWECLLACVFVCALSLPDSQSENSNASCGFLPRHETDSMFSQCLCVC